jgi:hypothetical protein
MLVDQHGDDAVLQAAQRADELLEDGRLGGWPPHSLWLIALSGYLRALVN